MYRFFESDTSLLHMDRVLLDVETVHSAVVLAGSVSMFQFKFIRISEHDALVFF
jgi:hypothetical protein